MKDELAKLLIDPLRACVQKLAEVQAATEGTDAIVWIETLRGNEAIKKFTSDEPHMTLTEGLVYDTFDAALTKLEQFAAQFRGIARTPDQHRTAGSFKEFVEELGRSMFGREKRYDLS